METYRGTDEAHPSVEQAASKGKSKSLFLFYKDPKFQDMSGVY